MKVCGHCYNQVEDMATKCPYCLENPNDGASTIWGWVVIALGVFIAYKLIF